MGKPVGVGAGFDDVAAEGMAWNSLRSDLVRFAFLLGGNDGEPLFQGQDP